MCCRCVFVTAERPRPHAFRYELPDLKHGEVIVADIHSHGLYGAGFSAKDDVDDAGATRLALVVGKVNADAPEVDARLCLNGLFVPLRYVEKETAHAADDALVENDDMKVIESIAL